MTFVQRFEELGRYDVEVAGGKGANLGELCRAGIPVPPGFVLTTAAYDAFVEAKDLAGPIARLATLPPDAPPAEVDRAAQQIEALFLGAELTSSIRDDLLEGYAALGPGAAVAVRSSATAEDLADASFAGQQETFLNVRGPERLLEAVVACWASLWTARTMAYRSRQGIDPSSVSLAVVVQQMVDAEAAGVLFTANPVNGRRSEVVVGAAWGLGEAVVSGEVSTDDLVVDKASGRVLSRTTADKQVMTVFAEHGVEQVPVPDALRRQPVLDDATVAELVRLGALAERHFGAPQDVEWVLGTAVDAQGEVPGDRLFVVQARPITALPEPAADPPSDWTVPRRKDLYFRASIVEQLPDPLSPLFADLVDQSVARSLHAMVSEFLGRDVLKADDVGLPTVNGYAYYRYTRGGMVRFTLRTPRALRFLGRAERRWREHSHPRYRRVVESWRTRRPGQLPATELLRGARELLDAATTYYTTVQTVIPLAAGSEVTFTRFYDRLVRRAGDPPARAFLLGFDSLPIRAERSLYDLAGWARQHPDLAAALLARPPQQVLDVVPPVDLDPGLWQDWRSRFEGHLDHYGHTLYNLDFVNPVPADDPVPLLETLRFYLRGGGTDPRQRQHRSAARRDDATAAVLHRLGPLRRAVFTRLLAWAQQSAPLREDALADVGLAWPTLRRLLLELGRRLVAAGAVDDRADVFWLRLCELEADCAALDRQHRLEDRRRASGGRADDQTNRTGERTGAHPVGDHRRQVEERRYVWRGQRLVTPPQLLPPGAWTRLFDRMMPAVADEQGGDVLRGVAASSGTVTAPARVLTGPADFARLRPGEVLVAGITTPAWTPLFAMASAVVTDVGGPLSHSSIVAREYGIPAVLGTGVATRRIRSGQPLRVDGDAGTVQLLATAGEDMVEEAVDGGPGTTT